MYVPSKFKIQFLKKTTYKLDANVFLNQFEQCITFESCVELSTESSHYDSINVKSCSSIRVRCTIFDQLERLP